MIERSGITVLLQQPVERFVDAAEAADGIDVRALRAGDVVTVYTCHSAYRLRVRAPERGEVRARGSGAFLTREGPARVLGASLSGRGTLVKSGWVLVGYKLLLGTEEGELITSRVCRLSLNGVLLEPVAGVH